MAWSIEGPQRPVGVREILIHPYGAEGANRLHAYMEATSELSFNPRFNSGELRGADSLAETAAILEALEWSFNAGGIDPDVYAIVYGFDTVTHNAGTNLEYKELQVLVGENLPYFTIYAIATDDEEGDHLVTLHRCKLTSDNTSGFSYGSFFMVGGNGLALPDIRYNAGKIYDFEAHAQRTNVFDEAGITYDPDRVEAKYPFGLREVVVQRKITADNHYLTRFQWGEYNVSDQVADTSSGGGITPVSAGSSGGYASAIWGSGFTHFITLPETFNSGKIKGTPFITWSTSTDLSSPLSASNVTVPTNSFTFADTGALASATDKTGTIVIGAADIVDGTLEYTIAASNSALPQNQQWTQATTANGFTYSAADGSFTLDADGAGTVGFAVGSYLWLRYRTKNYYVGVKAATKLYYRASPALELQIGAGNGIDKSNVTIYATQSRNEFSSRALTASEFNYVDGVVKGQRTGLARLYIDVLTVQGRGGLSPSPKDGDGLTVHIAGTGLDVTHYSRIDSAENFSFTPSINSNELMGNDTITAANGRIDNATAEFQLGGIDLDAHVIIFGKPYSVSGTGEDLVYTQSTYGGVTQPFFNLKGMSQANDAESTAIVEAPRAQVTSSTDGFNDAQYQNNSVSLNLIRKGRGATTAERKICLIYRDYKRYTNLPDGPEMGIV